MHELYELKKKLCKELEDYSDKKIDAGSLEVVDKLSHTIKNLDKIIDKYDEEEGYSNRYDGSSYRGRSYARKRDSMGRYSRRGYSRADETMISELRDLMHDAPDERTRQEFQSFISKLESM